MKKSIYYILCALMHTFLLTSMVQACETCAVYSPPKLKHMRSDSEDHPFKINWFTRYSNLDERLDGSDEGDAFGEEIESYINQLSVEYQWNPKLKIQLSIPFLSKEFKQLENGNLIEDDESGLGDISFLAKYKCLDFNLGSGNGSLNIITGIKTPTGDSDRINSGNHDHNSSSLSSHQMETSHDKSVQRNTGMHHETHMSHQHPSSAIFGHNVALGSGSWDFILGAFSDWSSGLFSVDFALQYYFRTEGDFDYEFADDLYVSTHLGYKLHEGEDISIAVRGGLLGEFRDSDKMNGVSIDHTALDSWYIDLTVSALYRNILAEIGVDIPIDQESKNATLVPDNRIRLSVGYYFS